MKNVFVLLICLIASFGNAASSPDVSVVNTGNKSFALYMDNACSGFVQVKLTDKDGIVLLNDHVKSIPAFARKYNLVNLPGGDYVLSVESGTSTVLQTITVFTDGLMIPTEKKAVIFAPAIRVGHEKLDLTLLCLNESAVTIEIIDDEGRSNYAATTQEKGSVERRFNVTNLTPGRYTVITTVKGKNFTHVYNEVFNHGTEIAGN